MVGGKTCLIDWHLVSYVQARCATICFDSSESLNAVLKTTPVLKGANLYWAYLVLAKCMEYKSRLAAIYAKCSVPVACPITSGSSFPPLPVQNSLSGAGYSSELKPTPLVSLEVNDRFVIFEHSLVSLVECIDKLAKRLDTPRPTNQRVNIVISKSSGVAISGRTKVKVVMFDFSVIKKLKNTLHNLLITVMGLSAKIDNAGMNNPPKQDNIVHWHKDMNNSISIFMETKLKRKIHSWIVKRFKSIYVFTSELDTSYLRLGIMVVMNNSLARHVYKISKVPGQLLSIKLFFKDKLSILILGLYAEASFLVCFSQADKINSLMARAVNEFSFVILGGNFNENGSHRCASFKKCLDLELVNSLVRSLAVQTLIWSNSCRVVKVIDYVLVFANLVSVLVHYGVLKVDKHFDTDHWAVSVSVSLIKVSRGQDSVRFASLISHWASLDSDKALMVQVFLDSDADFNHSSIRSVINRLIKSFASDKSYTIKSVLEHPFCKVELDHLVVGNKLILEPDLVKAKPLEYVFNGVFSDLFDMVFDLSDDKAAGLSSIFNELWKHCDKFIMDMFLELLNTCLISESMPSFWKEAWVLMIPKPYEWESILTNTHFIALIEMAHKILFKILSDRISLTYSSFDVLCSNNFSVLKGTSIQSPIFAVSSVIKNALEKNRKLWLVLQNMQKTYNSVDWEHLRKIKRQENVCGYRLNSHFISKNGHLELVAELSSFFAAGAFVNDTIWIGSNQSATQHILNVASLMTCKFGHKVSGLLSSTLVKLQAIALVLECVLLLSSAALDVCKSKVHLICLDFHILYWVEHQHIVDIIHCKNLKVEWVKIKDHSDIMRNDCTDAFAAVASDFVWHLPPHLKRHCLLAGAFCSECYLDQFIMHIGKLVLTGDLILDIDWLSFSLVWHPDLHMAAGFMSKPSAGLYTYFIKKQLYSKYYLSVLCLFCSDVEVSNHVFSCEIDFPTYCQLLNAYAASWELIFGFVLNNWFQEAVSVFYDPKLVSWRIVDFVHVFGLSFKNSIWLLSAGIIKLLGIVDAFGVGFGFHKSCSFFSGIGNNVLIHIVA
ncbi:hypothetical protein G9A89_019025 [Geosiphon pyriformis]|nr:hypothetical protein G9A89_019025 [Geosiphon pyriformis]